MTASLMVYRIKSGRGFSYELRGQKITDQQRLKFIKSLRIPPAWRNVRIASNARSKILVTGIDNAGRKQYIYHPSFRQKQEQAKFERILRFADALPRLRQQLETDLARRGLPREKVMAAVISIMDRTHIRIGNDSYASENNTYGLTTMRSKHTTVSTDTITFDFTGKSGKQHTKKIADRRLARIVRQLDELPGYEVFKYYDDDGSLKDVKSSDVNQYIKETMGEEFSAKDFRTWAGTLLAATELATAEYPSSEKERKKVVSACVKKVARRLGNTPAIARSSYIAPRIVDTFLVSNELQKMRQVVLADHDTSLFSADEHCVLTILKA